MGEWTCSKDRRSNCGHITSARHHLQKLIQVDPSARDHGAHDSVGAAPSKIYVALSSSFYLTHPLEPRVRSAPTCGERVVSYLPIHPPFWASLPNDPTFYPRTRVSDIIPSLIPLDVTSSCCCSDVRTLYSPTATFEAFSCTIYTLTEAHESHIQLQRCPSCLRRFIGPDARELHLFNFNNRILLTHELLDDYTSMYTSSETPFTAWVTVLSRRYQQRHSPRPFLSEDLFRTIWFAYVWLQHSESKDECPVCGPIPHDTIWDGITLAFSQKHLLPSLCPPTVSNEKSLRRENVRYQTVQQLITDSKLRKTVRKVIMGRSLILSGGNDSGDEELDRGGDISKKAADELLERVGLIPDVCNDLSNVNNALGRLFTTHFGISALSVGQTPPGVYQRFFIQVRLLVYFNSFT